jgi:lipid II:glycine glycyltransferase (peptidoglycan interpeptide bridge formation enzyme)
MESLQNTRDGLKNQYTNELVHVAARADKVKNYEAHVVAAEETKKRTQEEMKHQETFLTELQSEISEIEQRIAVRERTRIDVSANLFFTSDHSYILR